MTKVTVKFNYDSKPYDFITDRNNINIGDLVCVVSPVSESGLGIARVSDIEENTDDLNHSFILSKLSFGPEIPKEFLSRNEYFNGQILLKDNELYFMNRKDKTNDLQKNINFMLDYEIDSLILRKCLIRDKIYELRQVDSMNDKCIEIDLDATKIYIEVEEYNFDKDLNITDWRHFDFEYDNQYCEMPKDLIEIEVEGIETTLDDAIEYLSEKLDMSIRYRLKDCVEDNLGCYFEEMLSYYDIGCNENIPLLCKKISLSSKRIRETALSNVENSYKENIAAYTVELITPIEIEVPYNYNHIKHLLQENYIQFATIEVFAMQQSSDVWYDNDDYDTEPIEFDYSIYTVIDCNPTY